MRGLRRFDTILRIPAFRAFWTGFTLSSVGDAMTNVALVWYVYDTTRSAEMLGLFTLVSTAPVLVGGLVAGHLLDRFDRGRVMLVDSVFRGCVVGSIPILHALGLLALWHLFAVGAIHGLLKMVTWAGAPSIVPSLVPEKHLDTANAMETLAWTTSGVLGPALAGALIPLIGAPNILIFDALTFACFAVALRHIPKVQPRRASDPPRQLTDAAALLVREPVLLSTTLMFMSFNLGLGLLFVWLPVLAAQVLQGGPELFGILLGSLAAGEVVGSLAAGAATRGGSRGQLIWIAQLCSGLVLLPLVVRTETAIAVGTLFSLGALSGPLTIWAQTLRMKVIPADLRGRMFALLRTLMQATIPAGGGVAGIVLPLVGVPALILGSALFIGLPGILGGLVRPLRRAGGREVEVDARAAPD